MRALLPLMRLAVALCVASTRIAPAEAGKTISDPGTSGSVVAVQSSGITPIQDPALAYLEQRDQELLLGNRFLELHLDMSGPRPAVTALVNKLSGRTLAIDFDSFVISFEAQPALQTTGCTFQTWRQEDLTTGGKRLVLELASETPHTSVRVIYELANDDFFCRRRLELVPYEPVPLRRVDAWILGVDGTAFNQGFGEPVFLEDTFWGLEYPAGHHNYANGRLSLTHFPGRTVSDLFVSKTAVLGVTRPGDVAAQFQRYIKSIQATASGTKLFINYNTWWTLGPGLGLVSADNCLSIMESFRTNLFQPYGESFDNFTIDDGWDNKNSLWEIRSDLYPDGFHALEPALRGVKAELGLWLSPSSGYLHADWGAQAGYEQNSNPWYLCQSGPRYRRDIVQVLTNLAREYDLSFFKLDGFCPTCEADGHGHLPGSYSQEANVDAYIELLQAVRQVRQDIFLDALWEVWLSPWWLMYSDAVWGTLSRDYPDLIVPAPIYHDSATTTRDAAFRIRCQQHPGFPPTAIEHFGIVVWNNYKWEDDAMIVLGRGGRLLTLYINPSLFKPDDWAFLASLLKWARPRGATLENTKLILGDPIRREPYGYAHFNGQDGIIALRNPFIEPRRVELRLDESVGLQSSGTNPTPPEPNPTLLGRIVYPYHQTLLPQAPGAVLALTLSGYETLVLEFSSADPAHPELAGVRGRESRRTQDRIDFDVYARPGQTIAACRSLGTNTLESVKLGEDQIAIGEGGSVPFSMPGTSQATSVDGGELVVETHADSWRIEGACRTSVPKGSKATIHLVCEPGGLGSSAPLKCFAQVNGTAFEVRPVAKSPVYGILAAPYSGPYPRWSWYQFDLPEGQSEVSVQLEPGTALSSYFSGEVAWWLRLEHPLTNATLSLHYTNPLPSPRTNSLPLPLGMDKEHEIITLQSARRFYAGNRWSDQAGTVVYLDEAEPDYVHQESGELRRNRSVSNEPMVIAGQSYTRGLGTHATSTVIYGLTGGQFDFFLADVGHQDSDHQLCGGAIVFQVWADHQLAFDSGLITKGAPATPVLLNIRGAQLLELRTLDGGDGTYCDQANWADARLLHQRLEVGVENRTVVFAGQAGCVPLSFRSTVELTNLSFTIRFPPGAISNPTLTVPEAIESVSNLVLTASNVTFALTGHLAPSLEHQTLLASFCFDVEVEQPTRFLPFSVADLRGMVADGTSVTNATPGVSKVAILAKAPLLESLSSTNRQPRLHLYGRPGRSYLLETTTRVDEQAPWNTHWQGVLTNSVQEFRLEITAGQIIFLRAQLP